MNRSDILAYPLQTEPRILWAEDANQFFAIRKGTTGASAVPLGTGSENTVVVADATARKTLSTYDATGGPVAGSTEVLQLDKLWVKWELKAADVTTDDSWRGVLLTDADGKALQDSLPPISEAGESIFFLEDEADPIIAGYKVMDNPAQLEAETYVVEATVAEGQIIQEWVTDAGLPGVTFIPAGAWQIHLNAFKTGGSKDVHIYNEVYKRAAGGAETLLGTTALSIALTDAEVALPPFSIYIAGLTVLETDRVVTKTRMSLSGGGSDPTSVTVGYSGSTGARLTLPAQAIGATPEASEVIEGISRWATEAEADAAADTNAVVRAKHLNLRKEGGGIVILGTADPTEFGANTGADSLISGSNNYGNSGAWCSISGQNNYNNSGSHCLISGSYNQGNFGTHCSISGQNAPTTTKIVTSGVTITAATDRVNKTAHGLVNSDPLRFTSLTGGAGLDTATVYYVVNATVDDFQVAFSPGDTVRPVTTDYTDAKYITKAVNYADNVTIGGDNNYSNTGDHCSISGQSNHTNSGNYCLISGQSNYGNSGEHCSISGEGNHSNSGPHCSISGGYNYNNSGGWCSISGYYHYNNDGNHCTISGFYHSGNSGDNCSISGGSNHSNSGSHCSISGQSNYGNSGDHCSISGRTNHTNSGSFCSISGSSNDNNSGDHCSISGSYNHNNSGDHCSISGYYNQGNSGHCTSISGGGLFAGNHTNTGSYCSISGQNNHSNAGDYCVISGRHASSNTLDYARVHGGGTKARIIDLVPKTNTTDATPKTLTLGGAAEGATNRINIPADTAWLFTLNIIAKDSTSAKVMTWSRQGMIMNDGGVTTLDSLVGIGADRDVGALGASVAITADDANDCLDIEVTGVVATNIDWSARMEITQVG